MKVDVGRPDLFKESDYIRETKFIEWVEAHSDTVRPNGIFGAIKKHVEDRTPFGGGNDRYIFYIDDVNISKEFLTMAKGLGLKPRILEK